MDVVEELYSSNKLIVRAMDIPSICRMNDRLYYDCSIWANEFELMQNQMLSSVSSTLIVPGVSVSLYKSIGFLVNASTTDAFHICKTDSCSCGNLLNGDFKANKPDFNTTDELADYILRTKAKDINEININVNLEDVVGLVFIKSAQESRILKRMLAVIKCLYEVTGNVYPVYEYDKNNGIINKIELTDEIIRELEAIHPIDNVDTLCFITDSSEEMYEKELYSKFTK